MNQRIFTTIEPPWVFLLNTQKNTFDEMLIRFRKEEARRNIGVLLRGGKMQNIPDLLKEIAASLQFPSYFGENWNALQECINDLSWLPGDNYFIGINDIHELLIEETAADLKAFLKLMDDTAKTWGKDLDLGEAWGRPAKPFHIVLQYESEFKKIISEKFVGLPIY